MKKINLIEIEFVVLLVLILIPFANCYDIYGNGSDVQQNMCGDGFCQPTETAASCPADCTSPQPLPSSPTTNPPSVQTNNTFNTSAINQPSAMENNITNPLANQSSSAQNNSNQPATTGNLPLQNTSLENTIILIIIGIIVLIIIGIIVYLIIRKKKNNQTPAPAVSSQ